MDWRDPGHDGGCAIHAAIKSVWDMISLARYNCSITERV